MVHDPSDVAHHRLGRHGAVRDDLRHPVRAVALGDVFDNLVAPLHAEVDVEVRQRDAFGIEETLEQQVVLDGIELGDAETPGHQRPGAAAAARPDRDAVVLGPLNEIRHDQEVPGKTHLGDGGQLQFQTRGINGATGFAFILRHRLPSCFQALLRLPAQQGIDRHSLRHRVGRQVIFSKLKTQIAATRDFNRVLDRLGDVLEQIGHLLAASEILLCRVAPRPAGIGQHAAVLDADPHLVRIEIIRLQEHHMIRRHHRQGQAAREVHGGMIVIFLKRLAGTLQLQIKTAGEPLLINARQHRSLRRVAGQQHLADFALDRAR